MAGNTGKLPCVLSLRSLLIPDLDLIIRSQVLEKRRIHFSQRKTRCHISKVMENANTLLYSQTRQQVVRQDWRERKPAGAGGGESSLPEWGRTKDGNLEEKEKDVTGGGIEKIGT